MENVLAARQLPVGHVLVADGANVVVRVQIIFCSIGQAVDLAHGGPAFDEGLPAGLGLTPYIAIGVDQHHYGPDCATRLEKKDPASVEEEKDGKAKFYGAASSFDVVDCVVERFPRTLLDRKPNLKV